MDLDTFKQTWQAYDRKLDQTQQLGQQLLAAIQRDRSKNTIDKMIRELRIAIAILLGIVVIFSAIVLGNPFDYTQPVHFVPALTYSGLGIVGVVVSLRHLNRLHGTTLSSHNLYQALTELIPLREQHTRLMKQIWLLGMLAGAMVMLPTVARRFSENGWVGVGLIMLFPICLVAASAWLANRIGLFTDHYLRELREQAAELVEMNVTIA